MKKIVLSVLITLVSASQIYADQYLSENNPKLTEREYHSLKLAKKWMNNGNKSFRGKDGKVSFLFGATMPRVVTAPLRITDIELQVGEKVREVQIGDTVRWMISPSISGEAPNEISHIIVKPTDVGLSTTLAIFTNKRTYHLNLVSRKKSYMPIVGFRYTDAINRKWDMYKNYMKKQDQAKSFSVSSNSTPRNISSLNFNYKISGSVSWKPLRVYNDGIKTYIQMPKSMKFREAPVLMVLDKHDNKQLVNYRLKGDRFIVDKLFDEAILIVGVGSDQEKVLIQKSNRRYRSNALDILNPTDDEDY
jgi:type IV secretion system protein VirB9